MKDLRLNRLEKTTAVILVCVSAVLLFCRARDKAFLYPVDQKLDAVYQDILFPLFDNPMQCDSIFTDPKYHEPTYSHPKGYSRVHTLEVLEHGHRKVSVAVYNSGVDATLEQNPLAVIHIKTDGKRVTWHDYGYALSFVEKSPMRTWWPILSMEMLQQPIGPVLIGTFFGDVDPRDPHDIALSPTTFLLVGTVLAIVLHFCLIRLLEGAPLWKVVYSSALCSGCLVGVAFGVWQTKHTDPADVGFIWLPLLGTTLPLLALVFTQRILRNALCEYQEYKRLRVGCCTHCGYDLRGTKSKECPECGAHVTTEQRSHAQPV